jgi:uncharacterized DUF497 family protein
LYIHLYKYNLEGWVDFEWDAAKARSNLAKHGVSFELAARVFDDPLHVVLPDRIEDGEQRWHCVGTVGGIVLLVVVHTYPDPGDETRIRLIGARKATSHERRRYEQD